MLRAMRALLLLCVFMEAALATAQTVGPAVVEIAAGRQNVVEGHFEVVNNSLEPMGVLVEPKGFTIDRDGVAAFGPLPPGLQLQLSATSLRLPARQRRTIYYRVTAAAMPAWFCIYSTFLTALPHGGMQVALEMPHTVYLLRGPRPSARMLRLSDLRMDDGILRGVVHNDGDTLVRLRSVELVGPHSRKEESGFPLLPGGAREFVFRTPAGATQLRMTAAEFTLNTPLP